MAERKCCPTAAAMCMSGATDRTIARILHDARLHAASPVANFATSGEDLHEARSLGFVVALVVFALDQLTKWLVTGPLGVDHVGDQLVAAADLQLHLHREQRHLARPAQRHDRGRALDAGRADRGDRRRRRLSGSGARRTASTRSRSAWCWAARSATSSIASATAMSSTSPTCILATFRPFLIFNVGDAAISIGVVILLLRAFLSRKDQQRAAPEETIEHA